MSEYEQPEQPEQPDQPTSATDWGPTTTVAGFAIGTAGMAILYRTVRGLDLHHTSLLFIGIPAVLAILLAMTPRTKSATGAIMKGMTLALLITAPLMGEGFICILMASPIFYLVGGVVGALVDWRRRKRAVTLSCCALVLLPMSLEGIVPTLSFDRHQTVEVTRTIDAPAAQVEATLAQSPRIATSLPRFLSIGFPHPIAAQGSGLLVGSIRTIRFSGAEGAPPGDLVVRITAARPGYVCTDTVSDATKLASWLSWQRSEVAWHALDATHTSVTWRLTFERQLDPAWYFVPWQRFAVHQAASFLIEANATPHP